MNRGPQPLLLALTLVAAGCEPAPPERADVQPAVRTSPAEEIRAWRDATDAPLPAGVRLADAMADSAVLALLRAHDVAAYAVYTYRAGLAGAHEVDPSRAGPHVIAAARRATVRDLRRAACIAPVRLANLLAAPDPAGSPDAEQRLRTMLGRAEHARRAFVAARAGAPVIYALEVVGAPGAIARLAEDARVAAIEAAARVIVDGEPRVLVPRPRGPPLAVPPPPPGIASLRGAELVRHAQERATVRLPECR